MDDDDNNDTLASFVKENTLVSGRRNGRDKNNRYDYDKNTIEEMEN